MNIEDYIKYWRRLNVSKPPYVHYDDRDDLFNNPKFEVLSKGTREGDLETAPGNKQLHLNLLPAPHTGDLQSARIILVGLNPSVDLSNYADEENESFRSQLVSQLHQRLEGNEYPLLTLDPNLAGTGGYKYANKPSKFGRLIEALAPRFFNCDTAKARRWLSQTMATIEIMPYKSRKYHARCDNLPSVRVARDLLKNYLRPKALNGELLVIVTRHLRDLGLQYEERRDDFVLYHPTKGNEAMRSHFTPSTTDGGDAIVRWCGKLLSNGSDSPSAFNAKNP